MSRARHRLTGQRHHNLDKSVLNIPDVVGKERMIKLFPTAEGTISSMHEEWWDEFNNSSKWNHNAHTGLPGHEGMVFGGTNKSSYFPSYIPYLLGGGASAGGMNYLWNIGPIQGDVQCHELEAANRGYIWSNVSGSIEDTAIRMYSSVVTADDDNNVFVDNYQVFNDWFNPVVPPWGTKFRLRIMSEDLNDWIEWQNCYIEEICEQTIDDHRFAEIILNPNYLTKSSGGLNFANDRSNGDPVKVRIAGDIVSHHHDEIVGGDLDILGITLDQNILQPSFGVHSLFMFDMNNEEGSPTLDTTKSGYTYGANGFSAGSSDIISAELHIPVKWYYGIDWDITHMSSPPRKNSQQGPFFPYFNKSGDNQPVENNVGFETRYYNANFFVRGIKASGFTLDCLGVTYNSDGTVAGEYGGWWHTNWTQYCGMSNDAPLAGATWALSGGISQGVDITTIAEGNADFNIWNVYGQEPPWFGGYKLESPLPADSHNHDNFLNIDVTDIARQQISQNGGAINFMLGLCGDHYGHGQSADDENWIKAHSGMIRTATDWGTSKDPAYEEGFYLKIVYTAFDDE